MRHSPLNAALTARSVHLSDVVKYFKEIDPAFMWLFGLTIVVLPILRFVISHLTQKHTIKQKNLELLLSAYKTESMTKCDEFVIEHIISGIYKRQLSFPTIQALLSSRSPIDSFEIYKRVKNYVKMTNNKKSFRLKKKYGVIKICGYKLGYWVSVREFIYYFVSMMISFGLSVVAYNMALGLKGTLLENIPTLMVIVFISLIVVVLVGIGLHFLKVQGSIRSVKYFLRLQLTNC